MQGRRLLLDAPACEEGTAVHLRRLLHHGRQDLLPCPELSPCSDAQELAAILSIPYDDPSGSDSGCVGVSQRQGELTQKDSQGEGSAAQDAANLQRQIQAVRRAEHNAR